MKKNSQKLNIRLLVSIVSMLLFPITMIYFSPGMVFRGARLGIFSGSYVTFLLLFICTIFFGRLWCAWLCPAGGVCEVIKFINPKPYTTNKLKIIKYVIWCIWLAALILVILFVGHGFSSVDLFLGTSYGVSIYNLELLSVYYVVMGSIVTSSLLLGNRGFCHTLCWMAPFMVLGRKVGNKLGIRGLHLGSDSKISCTHCRQCEKYCPMSLPITKMIKNHQMEHPDCILCNECVKACSHQKLSITFKTLN